MSKKYQQKKDSIISEIQTTFKRYKYLSDTSIASIDFGDGRDSDDFIIVNRPKDERGYDLSDTGASDIFFREAADGFLVKKAFTTEVESSLHSEEIAVSYFNSNNIPNQNIKKIYSELEPCSLENHMCKHTLQRNYPKAEIQYSYDYPGSNNASNEIIDIRRNSINQRAKDLNNLLK